MNTLTPAHPLPCDYPPVGPWIDGQLQTLANAARSPVVDPATHEVLAQLHLSAPAQVEQALQGAQKAFLDWRSSTVGERSRILRAAAAHLRSTELEIATHLTREQGKPLEEALTEVRASAEHLEWHAEECRRLYGRVVPARDVRIHQYVVKEPVGVVAALTPWNFPLSQAVRKVAAALGAGCTVVLKGPENTPSAVQALALALHVAGLPPGCLQLVWGTPGPIAEQLVASPCVRAISFTGSVPVGKALAGRAAARMQRLTLELGGHAPVIVCPDADITLAARTIAKAKFRNAGQVCISPSRIYVHQDVEHAFVDAFLEQVRNIQMGHGLDPSATMGPLAHEGRVRAMAAMVADAQAHGARLVEGGSPKAGTGHFFQPTVLTAVPESARLMREEPFGPVAPIATWTHLDEVLGRCNGLDYGLAGYAFTESNASAGHIARTLAVGQLAINHAMLAVAEIPVSGMRDSGIGTEGGSETFEGYLQTKLVSNWQARV